jgi:hypothetical protein
MVSGTINATTATVNLGITTNTGVSIANNQKTYNTQMTTLTNDLSVDTQDTMNDTRATNYLNTVSTSESNIGDANTTSRNNAQETKNSIEQNADNSYETAIQNAVNSKEASDANADTSKYIAYKNAENSKETRNANAYNTNRTSKLNADAVYNAASGNAFDTKTNVQSNGLFTRETSEMNAKEILENGRYATTAAIKDARNDVPIQLCPYAGSPQPDYMRTRGVQIKVKTQSESAICQAGDTFARYGYALNQIWDVASSGLKLMKHFTYWKARELWVDDSKSTNNAINNFIHQMFLNGVTVWEDPEKIGKVNVYTN